MRGLSSKRIHKAFFTTTFFIPCFIFASGCNIDPYELGDQPGWKLPDASTIDGGPKADAQIDACVPTEEVCDGKDNNCNGIIDDGFDLMNDPEHCGECNNVCDFDNAYASCVEGECVMGGCLPGYWDLNEDDSDGCEYSCLPTNGGVETCDGRDNNCNGSTDEGYDLMNDPSHCGACNNVCVFFRGEGTCLNGECVLDYCHSGYVDKDGDSTNGCECMINAQEDPDGAVCDPTSPDPCESGEVCVDRDSDGVFHCSPVPPDLCDGIDTNCNGETDEDAQVGEPCYTHPNGCTYDEGTDTWSCEGLCSIGTTVCTGGIIQCTGQEGPTMEMCDGLDNNCNGLTDEDFDFQNDPANCGGCDNTCTQIEVPNAIPGCSNGTCVIVACLTGFHNIDGDHSTGCEYECTYTNGGVEICGDNIDNNCNGETDEGFDFQNDPQHCGECNNKCLFANGVSDCQEGTCVLVECAEGYLDLNNDPTDGCEYACTVTNNGVEICDNQDNDCNGTIDDGFDKSTDPSNCGSCGHACNEAVNVPTGAQVNGCINGKCVYECIDGFHDLNGDLALGQNGDGCEYECAITNGGVEDCNGVDNNCNGLTDEDENGNPLKQPCYTGDEGTEGVGICKGGTATCTEGGWGVCVGEITPEPYEQCDDLDHDCDGDSLNGFDLTTDILNCGGCGVSCFDSQPGNAYASGCSESTCRYTCDTGYHNNDGDWTNGCEYECLATTTPETEYCDGIDNNCDGQTDTPEHLAPPPEGYCRTDPGTPCEGTEALCTEGVLGKTWYCNYALGVETDPSNPNRVLSQETLCDDIDGNCSGIVDEPFIKKGQPCDDGGLGVCLGTGHYVCDATMTGTICEINEPGEAPQPEVCDGQDNDCNGIVDDIYAEDFMVHVQVGNLDFWIDAYEASRPDATDTEDGTMDHRSCSNPDVIPWHLVTWDEAVAACAAAGKRLCTEEEWQATCEGLSGLTYPYGDTYEPESCNSADYDHDCEAPNNNLLLPTGSAYGCPQPPESLCISEFSAFDMSGNVMEWTGTQSSASPLYYRIKGGSYNNIEPALTCQFDFISAEPTFFYYDIGFRCCADIPPWQQ